MPKSPLSAKQFSEFAASRRSVRDFLPTPVPQAIIDEILTDAMTAPSWSNTRGYMVAIATGERRDRISAELVKRFDAGNAARRKGWRGKIQLALTGYGLPKSDFKIWRPYPGVLKERSYRVGAGLYKTIGVQRGDAAGRDASMRRNFEFFGAPVALFFFVHKALGEYSVSDVSLFNQNLMLSAHAHGLGTCAQGVLGLWADVIRKEFEVPAEYKLVYGMSLGYASDHVVNQFGAERIPITEIVLPGK